MVIGIVFAFACIPAFSECLRGHLDHTLQPVRDGRSRAVVRVNADSGITVSGTHGRRPAQRVDSHAYYVAPSGNDGNPGSAAAPFRTIQHAADIAPAGATVIVRDGVYADCGNCSGVNYGVLFKHGGTPGSPITFRAAHSHAAVVDGGGDRRCMGFNDNLAYISIRGFHLQNCLGGIAGLGNAHDVLVQDNIIERIGRKGNCGTNGGGGFTAVGWQEAWNVVIDGNIIHDVGQPHSRYACSYTNDHGIYGHGHDVSIVNNVFYNNNSGWDIQIAGGPSGQNWLIANNTFGARNAPSAPGNIVIWTSSGPNTPSNITIENNISGLAITTAFVNCSFGADTANLVIRNNLIASDVALLTGSCSATTAGNRLNTDPLFVDAGRFDFHLQDRSPARNAGARLPRVSTNRDGEHRSDPTSAGAF